MISLSKKSLAGSGMRPKISCFVLFADLFELITCRFCLKCKFCSNCNECIESGQNFVPHFQDLVCLKRSDYIYDEESSDEDRENSSGIVRHEH